MRSVIIIGYGNIGQALSGVLAHSSEFTVKQIYYRNPDRLKSPPAFPVTHDLRYLEKADIYLLCVSDDAIEQVSDNLPLRDSLVVHTSGSMPMSLLERHKRRGVFYPLQSFSKDKIISWEEVPFCLEASSAKDLELLKLLASQFSKKIYETDSDQRKKLHLSAVVVNNFVNHLYYLGEELCKQSDIPFEILHPLILETSKKILEMPPYEAQTGPARRNDQKTLNSQLFRVKDTPLEAVYKTLTASILATYEREKL